MGKPINLSVSLPPLGIIVDKILAPFAIDMLLKKRVILVIDAFKGHLIPEIVGLFV